jgi:hypothetical protein
MNLPIQFEGKNILISGAGGGFDVFAALPLLYELEKNNKVVLASFSDKKDFVSEVAAPNHYPEGFLEEKCYLIPRAGVQLVRKSYTEVIAENNIDVVILVDGGVDSLMTGDEVNRGTVLEDFISLAAVGNNKGIPVRGKLPKLYLACVGFGTEQEEEIDQNAVLENMAALNRENGFLGVSALIAGSESFNKYKATCERVWKSGRKSHIHSRIIPAVEGQYGLIETDGVDARLAGLSGKKEFKPFIHPLMSIYWFFDLLTVVKLNKCVAVLEKSNTITDAIMLLRQLEPTRKSNGIFLQ